MIHMKRFRNSLKPMKIQIRTQIREGIKKKIYNNRNARYLDLVGGYTGLFIC